MPPPASGGAAHPHLDGASLRDVGRSCHRREVSEQSHLTTRVEELERQLAELREQRADALAEGAMLKTLLEDISKRQAVEKRLQTTEEWLELAQEAGGVAAYTYDFRTGELDWSRSAMALYGFAAGQTPTIEGWLERVHPDDRESVRKVSDAAIAEARDVDHEFRLLRENGSIAFVRDRGRVLRGPDGRPERLVGINVEITDQKAGEAALRDKEGFLHSVLDASTDCIKVLDRDGRLIFMNRNGQCAMEIGDFSTVYGRHWAEFWPEDSAHLVTEALRQGLAGKPSRFEAPCPTAAGTLKYWDVSVAPIRDEAGKVTRIVSVSRDISGRREAEEQLQLLNAELHHRIKNNLAMVQAMARSSLRYSQSPEAFEASFTERLEALAKTHAILRASSDSADLEQIVRTELEPFFRPSRPISTSGPNLLLPAGLAVPMGMIVHELATNAAKYGSLSIDDGSLVVRWTTEEAGETPRVTLEWLESGSKPSGLPERSGFGSRLLDRLARQLRGKLERNWEKDGLKLRLSFPLR